MRVAVFCTTPEDAYSGGRYHALMLARALVLAGNEVYFVTDHTPIFYHELVVSSREPSVQLCISRDFSTGLPRGVFDFVVLVPGTLDVGFYLRSRLFALERDAELLLLNFESPNWFNSLSPEKRNSREWVEWRRSAGQASVILSSSREGDRHARNFYRRTRPEAKFSYCYPAINTEAADAAEAGTRERRIVVMARFHRAEHKGSAKLASLVVEAMRGYTLVVIVGVGNVPAAVLGQLIRACQEHGVELEVRHRLSEREKFRELKRARLVVFPSCFEGFGYPAVEAWYCGTRCVAFDLPVLRETSGEALVYARHGDWDDLRQRVETALTKSDVLHGANESIAGFVSLEAMGKRLQDLLLGVRRSSRRSAPWRSSSRRLLQLRLVAHALKEGLSLRRFARSSFRTLSRPAVFALRWYRARRGRPASVCYFPPCATPQELLDHYLHAARYFPFVPGRCEHVQLFRTATTKHEAFEHRLPDLAPGATTDAHVSLGAGWIANARAVFRSERIFLWRGGLCSLLPHVARLCGVSVLTVNTPIHFEPADTHATRPRAST